MAPESWRGSEGTDPGPGTTPHQPGSSRVVRAEGVNGTLHRA